MRKRELSASAQVVVVGVDPGQNAGVAVIRRTVRSGHESIRCATLDLGVEPERAPRFALAAFMASADEHRPTIVAIERPGHFRTLQAASWQHGTAWIARAAYGFLGAEILEVLPSDLKRFILADWKPERGGGDRRRGLLAAQVLKVARGRWSHSVIRNAHEAHAAMLAEWAMREYLRHEGAGGPQ